MTMKIIMKKRNDDINDGNNDAIINYDDRKMLTMIIAMTIIIKLTAICNMNEADTGNNDDCNKNNII